MLGQIGAQVIWASMTQLSSVLALTPRLIQLLDDDFANWFVNDLVASCCKTREESSTSENMKYSLIAVNWVLKDLCAVAHYQDLPQRILKYNLR